ncbi:hypothetical protein BH11BAC7_BH11BAC7_37100 [soil metagenome]
MFAVTLSFFPGEDRTIIRELSVFCIRYFLSFDTLFIRSDGANLVEATRQKVPFED